MNKNTSSPAQSFWFFQPLLYPKVFPSYLPPSHLPPPSYLPYLILILHSLHRQSSRTVGTRATTTLGSAWNKSHNNARKCLKQDPSRNLKWDPSGSLKWDLEQELECKLPPSPSFFTFFAFGCVIVKKAMVTTTSAFFFSVARKKVMAVVIVTFFWFCYSKEEEEKENNSLCHLLRWLCCKKWQR